MEAAELHRHRHSWLPQRDSRTSGWLLTGNPIPIAFITIVYVYFVKIAGPRWMRHRKPFDLRRSILAYNFLTATLSLVFLALFAKYAYWDNGYGVLQDVDYGDRPSSLKIVHLSWWFYLFKLSELADTVFFVLRKKSNQVSALHVFHHVVVSWNMWLSVTYAGQAHAMFIICLNSFVHVVMYTYYFLAALGPEYRKYLWWKRYLTMLQIVQFSMLLLHCVCTVFAKGEYVPLFIWLSIAQALVFFVWFVIFYIRAYSIRCRITQPESSGKGD